MESAKYTTKVAVQAIQELGFGENTCSIIPFVQTKMQNNNISKTRNMKRPDISSAV